MSITVVCQSCVAKLRAPDSMAGHKTKCPKCGTEIVVPTAVSNVEEPSRGAPPPFKGVVPIAPRPNSPAISPPDQTHDSVNLSSSPRNVNGYVNRAGFWAGLGVGVFILIFTTIGLTLFATGFFAKGTTGREAKSQWSNENESLNSNDFAGVPANSPTPAALTPKDDHRTKPTARSEGLSEEPNAKETSNSEQVVREPATSAPPTPTAPLPTNNGLTKPDLDSGNLGSWGATLGIESGAIKHIGDVDVVLGFKFSTVYIPKNASNIVESNMPTYGIFFPAGYRKADGTFADSTAGFIPVNGQPHKIEYASNDTSIVEIFEDGSAGFRGPGKAVVSLHVAGDSISVVVTVIEIPVNASRVPKQFDGNATGVQEVVAQLGLPDETTEHHISWPKSQKIDGIFYSPNVGGGIATKHWRYREFPGAVIAIVGNSTSGWVWCVATHRD